VEEAHRDGTIGRVSPRLVPATVTELSRAGLLCELPGEVLVQLAARMRREEIAAGNAVVREGEPGERFYVVLSGVLGVSQAALGPRRLLRPGDTFGEVALSMDVPRTASVRALVPCVVASCDRATFDELVRPLFAADD
jgi:CRP-like cAMP-binding protein